MRYDFFHFLGRKISCVTWVHSTHFSEPDSTILACGSWDDPSNKVSIIKLGLGEGDVRCTSLSSAAIDADTTTMQFLDPYLYVGTSEGSLVRYAVGPDGALTQDACTPLARGFLVTDLHPRTHRLLAVGDGQAHILDPNGLESTTSFELCSRAAGPVPAAPSGGLPVHAAHWVTPDVFAVGGDAAAIALYDTRQARTDEASARCFLAPASDLRLPPSPDAPGAARICTALTTHPHQPDLLAAGNTCGQVAVWDLRMPTLPSCCVPAHEGTVTDLAFHPTRPETLLSCGLDGALLAWTFRGPHFQSESAEISDLRRLDLGYNALAMHPTLDLLACGCESDALYFRSLFTAE
eukprot:gnl/Trimastix_PCT/3189.p1 GENE.gnl/Trimastix_PCT/3189~~gnl/Trimastix_PCT/3189.p1  ORF type:complete len:350 (-),score=62.61 gnl/Trimastix_PCT/3189:11-1060(-)